MITFTKISKSWNDLPNNVIKCREGPSAKKFKLRLKNHIQHLMTGPEGNSEFCFPRRSRGKEYESRETKFTVPQGSSH